jgi:hypothetical protein
MERLSLIEALASVPDPRDPRGVRHPLRAILSLAAVAILAGSRSLEAIAQFALDRGTAFAHALGFTKAYSPTKSCLSKLFRRIDVGSFEAAVGRWTLSRLGEWQALAIDGKTLRGSRDGDAPGVHLLAAYVPSAAAVIAQMRVDCKTNEHKAALKLLGVLPLEGKVVTGDAMFAHRDVAEKITEAGGDYILTVKDNQPDLKAQIFSALHGDADFSPLPAETEGGAGAAGADGGQGAWADGDPADHQHDGFERAAGLAGGGAGLRA